MTGHSYLDSHPREGEPWSVSRSLDYMNGTGHELTAMWTGGRFLAFDAEIDTSAAKRLLPPGLKPSEPARALIFAADYVETGLGFDYREVGVLLHARLRGKPVLHVAWMVVDDDTALILGREMLGFPKKMAEIHVEIGETDATAVVRRRGVDLLSLHAELADPLSETPIFPHPIVNVLGRHGPLPNALLRMQAGERFHHGYSAEFELRIKHSAFDPLSELGLGTRQNGLVAVADLGLRKDGRPERAKQWPWVGFVRPTWLLRAYPFRAW